MTTASCVLTSRHASSESLHQQLEGLLYAWKLLCIIHMFTLLRTDTASVQDSSMA